jgi:hypothetical protein
MTTVVMASNDNVPLAADEQWVSKSNDVESPIMDLDTPGRAIGGIIDEMQRSAAKSPHLGVALACSEVTRANRGVTLANSPHLFPLH